METAARVDTHVLSVLVEAALVPGSYPTLPLSVEATDPAPSATPPSTVALLSVPIATAFFTLVVVPSEDEPIITLLSAPFSVRLSPKTTAVVVSDTEFSEPITVT